MGHIVLLWVFLVARRERKSKVPVVGGEVEREKEKGGGGGGKKEKEKEKEKEF